jgi:hypothetical protein
MLVAELQGESDEGIQLAVESETEFVEAAEKVVGAIRDAEMMRDAATERARAIQDRAAMFDRRAERLRDVLMGAMVTAGQKSLRLPEATLSLSEGCPRAVILEEDRIPERYWTTKVARTLDRRALLADLKDGHVEGATLDNVKPRMTIRTR